jgi:hypothetical protein
MHAVHVLHVNELNEATAITQAIFLKAHLETRMHREHAACLAMAFPLSVECKWTATCWHPARFFRKTVACLALCVRLPDSPGHAALCKIYKMMVVDSRHFKRRIKTH